MLNHKGTKIIETERLILRPFRSGDAPLMFKNWAGDREVAKFLTWNAHRSVSDSENVINMWVAGYNENSTYNWAIVPKEFGEPIGSISVARIHDNNDTAEIGYCIGKEWWGNGIMTEAFSAVIPYLFDVGFNRIQAEHAVKNPASGRVMQKCGLTYEGTLRQFFRATSGEFLDISYYSILREEFETCNKSPKVV
ncbi:MAG: GNAT family N-acetyltransferase [Oscillospiraceae bacterium]|nr:GNAT family N-acetyltransferase [Oscillospiraceae bacterium]